MKKEKKPAIQPGKRERLPARQKSKRDKSPELRVLILEDNPADADLMERQLIKDGMALVSRRADTRSGFLQALKSFRPQLILADYSLPKFDALQALELVRGQEPFTPFIVVTGSIGEEKAVAVLRAGADDYLLKDRLARLAEAVRHSLTNHRLRSEKMAAEESLRSNELLYHAFIDSSSDMAFLKDDKFRHLLANRELCRFYKKAEKEIIGKTDAELMDKSAAARCRKTDRQALTGNRVHVSDETFGNLTFETRKFPVKLMDNRIGVGGYIRDISEGKRVKEALLEAAARWRTTFDSMTDAVCLLDEKGAVRQCNRAMNRLLGLPYKKIIGRDCLAMICGVGKKNACSYHLLLKDGKRHEEETFWRQRWFLVTVDPILGDDGRVLGGVHIMADITERRQSQEMLQATSRRLELALNSAQAGTWDWNVASGQIDWSPQMFELFGLDSRTNAASFATWRSVLHPEDVEMAGERIEQALKQHANLDSDYRVRLPDGRIRWINALGVGIYDGAGRPVQMIGICQDISERKATQEQTLASLLEKEVLLKEIHHRVKNNLQVISGLLTLQAQQIDDERLQRVLQDSQSRIWTMALIHQTLYQSGNLADIDMADYIRSLIGNLLSSHARVAMPPNVIFDLQPLHLTIDKAIPLALVLNELVTNAMKHAFPDGRPGEIRISLQEGRGVKFYAPIDENHSSTYELRVADNGIGLPTGFDPQSLKSLGLQLVAMLSRQLDAALAFESAGGTIVTITFHCHEKP